MKRALILLASFALCAPAIAQNMEPGEWRLTSTTRSPDTPKPEVNTETKCVTKKDIEDVDNWAGGMPGCKMTPGKKTADSYSWQMSCPQARVSGSGSMRWTRTTVEVDTTMVAPDKTEIRTKVTGQRLGPCKK